MDDPPQNDCCSICHGNYSVPCQANCSHWFCGNCIMLVWDHGAQLRPCRCPLCRREITLLVPSAATQTQHRDSDVSLVLGKVERYNRTFAGHDRALFQRVADLPFFLRRLLRELMNPQRSLPFVLRARVYIAMFLSAIYVISPIDLIPEGIFGIFGLIDDFLIMLIFFFHISTLYRGFLHRIHGGS